MNVPVLEAIEAVADHQPALADDERHLDYGELRSELKRIARALSDRFGSGRYLLVRAPMRADFVLTFLGILYSGNVPVPVNPEAPDEEIEYMRDKCEAPPVLDPLVPSDYASLEPLPECIPIATACVIFTSGTSGHPKGVVISQTNLSSACDAIADYLGYHEHRSAAVVLPLHYSYALLSQVCCQLYAGGFVRLFSSFRNPIRFARIVEDLGLRTFCGVPSTFVGLVMTHRMKAIQMPSVRVLCSAGAAMDRSRYEEVTEIFPNATFFNNYGMTEASPRISWISDQDPRFDEPTCGRPMRGVEIVILDPVTHEPVSEGDEGVVGVRGPNITAGYLNDPERTAEAFTRDGFLLSGDIGRRDGDYLFLRGRADDLFNVAGEKVAPIEIERVLDGCPGIEQSAVIGVSDDLYGSVPIAFLRLTGEVKARDVDHFLKGRLPQVKWPRRLYEVRSFPTTPNGKLMRRRLSPEDASRVIREIS